LEWVPLSDAVVHNFVSFHFFRRSLFFNLLAYRHRQEIVFLFSHKSLLQVACQDFAMM
jgi:hypothetical protein